jgi:hypothetical protein
MLAEAKSPMIASGTFGSNVAFCNGGAWPEHLMCLVLTVLREDSLAITGRCRIR